MDVVSTIESVPVDKNKKPMAEIRILTVEVLD